jgi:UDP-N-acetylmuramoyl-tripeptide--D-alanyl-D-alanine ligase
MEMIGLTASPLFTLAQLAAVAGGELRPGSGAPAGAPGGAGVDGVSIDTRTLRPGDLFVPLPGRNADGHAFVAEAFRRGAAASLCARERHAALAAGAGGPLVVVEDVTAALQRLARKHRADWAGLLVGITGSSGKTTTKDLVAAAFATAMTTLKTEGNLNNHWGVPLTLLRLSAGYRAAVVEMGSSRPGEIVLLAAIAAPGAAIVTNAGSAHLEFFGSVDAVAREKAALGFALDPDATLIAGADSGPLMRALEGVRCRVVTYGFAPGAAVRPVALEDRGPEGIRFEVAGFPEVRLSLIGRHQVLNALAALAAARAFGLDPEAVARALAAYRPAKGRMEVRRARGAVLLVDCYNSNPESARAALDTLASWPGAVRRIAILGDMLELGRDAPRLHRAIGAAVRGAELWGVGERAEDYLAGARERAVPARVFADLASLRAALGDTLAPGTVVLLKASRGAALEQVLEGLEGEA